MAFKNWFGGIDLYFAPFISGVTGKRVNPNKLKDLLPRVNDPGVTIPQVLTRDAAELVQIASELADLGYKTINWNLGCPFAKVADKCRGSGLLPFPDIIDGILESAIPKLKTGLSVKMRSGYQRHDEMYSVINVLNRFPLTEIILHPRTGIQEYKGKANPEIFDECQTLTHHKLIYNGDIFAMADFNRIGAIIQPHAWMIGRGALRYPFLPALLNGLQLDEDTRRKKLWGFEQALSASYMKHPQGREQVLGKMKAVWRYQVHVFGDSVNVFRKIRKTRSTDEYQDVIHEAIHHRPLRPHPLSFAQSTEIETGTMDEAP
jgi:tRNA-dihydrouridine synthase